MPVRMKKEDEAGAMQRSPFGCVLDMNQDKQQPFNACEVHQKSRDDRKLKKSPCQCMHVFFAFLFYFKYFFPSLSPLLCYYYYHYTHPGWPEKCWLTFPTPHSPVTLPSCCRLHLVLLFLFALFFFSRPRGFVRGLLSGTILFFLIPHSSSTGLPHSLRFPLACRYLSAIKRAAYILLLSDHPEDRVSAVFLSVGHIVLKGRER